MVSMPSPILRSASGESELPLMQTVLNADWPIPLRWLKLCVRSKWEEAVPLALQMATEQGRMKFTRPLFRYGLRTKRW